MELSRTQAVVDGVGDGAQSLVNGRGDVLPLPLSHGKNAVGIHWLRISFTKRYLADLAHWLSQMWGDFEHDGFGLWSYDTRFAWANGASLNFDQEEERSQRVHRGGMTLDVPGAACDEMTAPDLQLLIEYCAALGCRCTRIDNYFDDYQRLVYPKQLDELIERNDYSGIRHGAVRHKWDRAKLIREEVTFGERGSHGNGKYLRFYNKELESDGQQKCNRWEVEFTGDKANQVFYRLASTAGSLDAFASLCSFVIAGAITFVHRTHEKNINRLELYEWWKDIRTILAGCVTIRTSRKKDSLTGKMTWIDRNVSPTLACLRKVFCSDRVFIRWLFDVCEDGDGRMNRFTRSISEEHKGVMYYRNGNILTNRGGQRESYVS